MNLSYEHNYSNNFHCCHGEGHHIPKINEAFMCVVTVEFNTTLLGSLPSNENSVSMLRSSSYVCLFAVINLYSHLKNHINWIKRSMELLFKNALIPPRPQVPTCYHKDSLPLNLVCSHLPVEIVRDPIPAIQRKELVI